MNVYKLLMMCLLLSGLLACSSKPMPEASASLDAAEEHDEYYLFKAKNPSSDVCYIYYPGGLVQAEAYAPYASEIAAQGAHAFLLRLNFDLAMLDANAADKAKQSEFAKRNCTKYVLGGHSLGGLAIAMYAETHPDDGLLFIASYPHKPGLVDQHQAPVMVLRGSNDLLATSEDIAAAKVNLPRATRYIAIEGGNHAQMGHYGPQLRDGEASISRMQQQRLLVQYTMEIISEMKKNNTAQPELSQ